MMSSAGLLRGRLQVSLKVFVTFFGSCLRFCEVLCDSVVGTRGQRGVVPEAPKHFCSHRKAEHCRAVVTLGRVCPRDAGELLCSDGQRICMLGTLVWVPVCCEICCVLGEVSFQGQCSSVLSYCCSLCSSCSAKAAELRWVDLVNVTDCQPFEWLQVAEACCDYCGSFGFTFGLLDLHECFRLGVGSGISPCEQS